MISLEEASTIVDAALPHAREQAFDLMTVAVLDAQGCVVALKMEGGLGLLRPDIATGKAWSALGMGSGTRNLASRAEKLPSFFGALAALADGRVLPVPDGVLIRGDDGSVVGACGASGDTADNDEACALVGIGAVGLTADPGVAQRPGSSDNHPTIDHLTKEPS